MIDAQTAISMFHGEDDVVNAPQAARQSLLSRHANEAIGGCNCAMIKPAIELFGAATLVYLGYKLWKRW